MGEEGRARDLAVMGWVRCALTASGTMEARPFLVKGFSFRLVRSRSSRSRTSQLGLRSISCLHISAPLLGVRGWEMVSGGQGQHPASQQFGEEEKTASKWHLWVHH